LFTLALIPTLLCGCTKRGDGATADHPQLASRVKLQDVTFRSRALNREMQYRVFLPAIMPAGSRLGVVYLLHVGGGGFRDWSNYSDVAKYAKQNLILVMPEGASSYYTNSATVPSDRYEDYVVKDLVADVEARFPAASLRDKRAIAGVSMGGFGAIKIAMKYPDLYVFAGGLSPAVDVPTRPFSLKRVVPWRFHSSIFGPTGSLTRRENDPYALARTVDPQSTPQLFLTCGEQEGLLPANRKLAAILKERAFRYEFVTLPGDHNWQQWDKQIPGLFDRILARLGH
jgi:S-formylglutathione hydrolase FrmB